MGRKASTLPRQKTASSSDTYDVFTSDGESVTCRLLAHAQIIEKFVDRVNMKDYQQEAHRV